MGFSERQVAQHRRGVLQHGQEDGRGADLQERGVLAHVGVADDHVQAAEALGVGVRLVPRVDDGPAAGGGRGDALPDVLGALAQAEDGAPCRLQDLAGAGVDLARDEERDEHLGVTVELVVPFGQVVLVAAVGVADRVRVVLEEVDLAADALLAQARLGAGDELGQDPLPRLVVDDDVADAVALGRGVLGVAADVEVEAGAVLQEDVGRAAPRDHPPEQVARHFVGAEAPLAAQREGHPVFVLDPEDAALHRANRTAAYASSCASSPSSIRRKVRRPFPRLRMATSRSPAARVRSGPASAAVAALTARRPGPSRPATLRRRAR